MTKSQKEDGLCPVCNRPGQRRIVKLLSNYGELWQGVHEDGAIHEWNRYDSKGEIKDGIACPVCTKTGKIITYRKDKIQYTYKNDYKISHGKKFCEITKQEDRDMILKFLGRYVGEEQQQPHQRKQAKHSKRPRITCSVCFKSGAVKYMNPKTGMTVYEHRDEPPISAYVYPKTRKKYFRYRRCYGGKPLHGLEELMNYEFGPRIHRGRPKI